jgi:hypothetical protein
MPLTGDQPHGMGLHKVMRTVKYRAQAIPRGALLSRVSGNNIRGLKEEIRIQVGVSRDRAKCFYQMAIRAMRLKAEIGCSSGPAAPGGHTTLPSELLWYEAPGTLR